MLQVSKVLACGDVGTGAMASVQDLCTKVDALSSMISH